MNILKLLEKTRERDSVENIEVIYGRYGFAPKDSVIEITMRPVHKNDDGTFKWVKNGSGVSKKFDLYKTFDKVVKKGQHQGWNEKNEPIINVTELKSFIEISLEIKSFVLVQEQEVENTFKTQESRYNAFEKMNKATTRDEKKSTKLEALVTIKEIQNMDIKLLRGNDDNNEV